MLVAFTLLNENRDIGLGFGADRPEYRRRLALEASEALAKAGGALRPGVSPRLASLGCFLLDGRWREVDEILAEMPPTGNVFLQIEVTAAITFLAVQRGENDRAWQVIRTLLPEESRTEPGDMIHQEGLYLQRLAATMCLDADDRNGARAWLEANDRWLAWSGSVLGRAEGCLAWANWLRVSGHLEQSRSKAEEALALAADPGEPLVAAMAQRLLGRLATENGDFAAADQHLKTSLTLSEKCEAPFERALSLAAIAELMDRIGNVSSAFSLREEVHSIALELNATRLLEQMQLSLHGESTVSPLEPNHAGLTTRELEVLTLVAAGQTNAEIARLLFITRRTVTSHVEHIFAKLNVRNRAEAGAVARELGLV